MSRPNSCLESAHEASSRTEDSSPQIVVPASVPPVADGQDLVFELHGRVAVPGPAVRQMQKG